MIIRLSSTFGLTQTWSTNQCLFSPGRFSIGPRCTPRHAAVPHASSSLPPSSLREPPSWTACVTASIESAEDFSMEDCMHAQDRCACVAEDFSTACTSRPTPRRHEPRRPIAAHVINVPPPRAPSRRPCQLWSRAPCQPRRMRKRLCLILARFLLHLSSRASKIPTALARAHATAAHATNAAPCLAASMIDDV